MKQFIIVVFVSVIVSISGLQFKDCGSKIGKFTKVVISGCDTTKNDCILKRNTSASISIELMLSEDVQTVTTVVHGKIMGVEMPFHLENPDACVNSGLACPLIKDNSYSYRATLPVLKAYPKVTVEVKWELKDQNNEDIICVLIPAKIQ
ncbi:NPC intracellular cholesterol transporter 2 homolog a [Eupeodes corollae]|uniref:NPC intracellular cholesterol transporter 2 homolog a n=1 Tax=Eupeodes corollae TaxID=290404 RepID=UPI00248FC65A|nr:NPC intracellular cholesterol transporter 2 homolog a [Eupeodes corollae]